MAKGTPTLQDYPAEFLTMWQLAVQGTLCITLPSRGKAVNLRVRMYSYRKRLEEEASIMAQPFKQVDLEVHPAENGQWKIIALELPWKKQVREQAAALLDPCVAESSEAPAPKPPVLPVEFPQVSVVVEQSQDTMDSALHHLGFGSEEVKKQDK